MPSINKVILIGHLGRDPELRYTPSGTPVAKFSMATTERWTDPQSGERKEHTEWHRIVVWSKQAEIAAEHLRKGKPVYIEGGLRTRAWTDREGNKRSTTEIRAQRMQFLFRLHEQGPREDAPKSDPGEPPVEEPVGAGVDDDVPF